jgi:hypothetical protein
MASNAAADSGVERFMEAEEADAPLLMAAAFQRQ